MTFNARELSTQDGKPTELWIFSLYGVNYRYTTAAKSYVFEASTYTAVRGLSHSEIELTGEVPKNNVTLYVPRDFPMMRFYESMPPSDVLVVTIFQIHRGDGEVEPLWTGRVMNGSRPGRTAEMYCENVFTSLLRGGLRGTYGRGCRHDLYSQGDLMCNVNPASHVVPALLDSVSGLVITSSSFIPLMDGTRGRLAGGMLEWEPVSGQIERRGLKFHSNETVEMTHAIDGLTGLTGLTMVSVYPGCAHTRTDCNDFYGNIPNYGGFPYIQRQNAMGGNSVM